MLQYQATKYCLASGRHLLILMQVGVELRLGKIGPNAMLIAQHSGEHLRAYTFMFLCS